MQPLSRNFPVYTVKTASEYVAIREFTMPNLQLPEYQLKRFEDGFYAVFDTHADLFEYDLLVPVHFYRCHVHSISGRENAFYLGRYLQ